MNGYDFSGWATRNNIRCSDGRVIMQDAFKHNDGQEVPLVWNHQHNDPFNVLGHALLENRDEGVYAYCSFNDSESGQAAKIAVQHGDVSALSIYANQLKQQGTNVIHGAIREVSLVLAGANPGAFIDSVISHGEVFEDEAVIYTDEEIELNHSDTESDDTDKKEEPKKEANVADEKKAPAEEPEKEETVGDVFDTLTDKQKSVVFAIIGQALEDAGVSETDKNSEDSKSAEKEADTAKEDEIKQSAFEENYMKHNVFENETEGDVLSHSEMESIIAEGKRYGSLKESVLAHGITDVDYLFPDAQNVNATPDFIQREMGWVTDVMGSVHHTPFARIKSIHADITADDARALGYIKGNLKKDEVFSLLKRTTTPQTIYKKQKLDRDDVSDITDFDVVAWIKGEMRMMLDEEIARAILVGDGRLSSSDDKIQETNIRPIWKDAALYTLHSYVTDTNDADKNAKALIRAAIKARKDYKGSGTPTFFTTEDFLTDMLLLEDNMGRVIYDTEEKLRTALRVSKIVTVPVMENLTREDSDNGTVTLAGLIVNLADYNVGADKGGAVSLFDDFDIDYNAQKYLIETRCSGALTKPYSAIALELKTSNAAG